MVRLRPAKASDARAIAELSRDLVERGLGWSWHAARVLRSISDPDTDVVVATETGLLLGFAILDFYDTRAHLSLLAVRASHQRRGIGRQLMEWQEQTALCAGIQTIELELRQSNQGGRRFYQELGFVEIAHVRGYYRGVETAIRMAKDIRRHRPDGSA
jgi:ribosomal-protein-alanine N-acetyltransferase